MQIGTCIPCRNQLYDIANPFLKMVAETTKLKRFRVVKKGSGFTEPQRKERYGTDSRRKYPDE